MNETLNTIYRIRTIHSGFSGREVAEEELSTILDACVCAANASARQSYSIIVVRDRARIREYIDSDAGIALIFCVDLNRIMDTAELLGHTFDANGLQTFITGSTDASLAAQTAAIAAKSIGIDCKFTNGIHRKPLGDVFSAFGLPEKYCFPLISLALGYPEREPEYLKGRLKDKGIVHYGSYSPLTEQEKRDIVAKYNDKALHLGMIDHWEALGFQNYLDWFYTKWCSGEEVEKQKILMETLIKTGFMGREEDLEKYHIRYKGQKDF